MKLKQWMFTGAAVIVLTFSLGRIGQGQDEGVKLTFDEAVIVGDTTLEPGEYEFRRASSNNVQTLRIFNKDKLRYETTVLTVPAENEKVAETTKAQVDHIDDKAYLDTIWVAGQTWGYHFVLPEKAERLKQELALNQAPEKAIDEASNSQLEKPSAPIAGDVAAESAAAAERESVRQESRQSDPEAIVAQPEPQAQAAESDTRIARLEQNPTPVSPRPNSEARPAPSSTQSNSTLANTTAQNNAVAPAEGQNREQLPATADGWAGFLLGGTALLALAAFLRRPREHAQQTWR